MSLPLLTPLNPFCRNSVILMIALCLYPFKEQSLSCHPEERSDGGSGSCSDLSHKLYRTSVGSEGKYMTWDSGGQIGQRLKGKGHPF